ncbi:MAG: cytochrome c biogenesis protein CcdA [Balneolaceae bacterium]|nr:cytochrome c biogenesis protein CcdA [Balneolaceae bacterium]
MKTTVRLDRNVVPRGSTFRAAVMLSVNKGWHINAHEPTLDYLIPTRISYKKLHGFTVTDTRYPEGSMIRFDFADTPISVYDGNIPIFMTLAASDTLEPGSHELTGKLRVQACNDEVCLAPSEIAISIPVEVSAAGTGYQPLYGELFETYTPDGGSVTDAFTVSGGTEIAAMFSRQGYFWAFLGIFLVGLALNLTPCVYPMLSVTVSLFGGQESKQNSLGHSFSMASVYVLGIMSMYSVLGVAAAYTGSLFGSWLQNPLVLGGIGVLIFALALSMFGLYELQPPKWIMQKFSGTQRATGITGHFLSGLVVGVFAAPCIGPPIIALLAFVGSQGDPLFGFLTMFVMAFGLGVPYLLLGTFSGLLGNLPRSGTWMVWVKKLFGVVLVGVALFYLALAFAPGYAAYVIPAVLLTGGVYLAFAKTGGSESRYFRFLKWGIGTVSVIVGILTVQNLMKPGIQWESYSDEKLQQARASGTPVMLDFYADWCIPCLEMDRNTFTDPEVIAATERFKKLKVDLTRYESERAQTLRRRFEVKGVPTIVFIGSDGTARPDARVVGYLPPELFLEKVNHARNTGLSQHMPLP